MVVSDGEVPLMGSIGCHFNANLPTSYIVFGSFFLTMLRSVVAARRLTADGSRRQERFRTKRKLTLQ